MSVLEAIRLRRRPSSAWATRHLPMRLHHWRGVARPTLVSSASPIGCTLVPRSLIITNWLDWEESKVKKSSTKTGKSQSRAKDHLKQPDPKHSNGSGGRSPSSAVVDLLHAPRVRVIRVHLAASGGAAANGGAAACRLRQVQPGDICVLDNLLLWDVEGEAR